MPYAGAGLYIFAGVGFGIPGFKVQIGVQGDISLGTVSIPAHAGAGLWVGSKPDDREPQGVVGLFSQGGSLVPARIYSAQLGFTAGLQARVRDILSGSIAVKLKLKVLFFSLTWKKPILEFNGICPSSKEENGALKGCDFPLLKDIDAAVAAEGQFGWGFIKMPVSFPEISLPSRNELIQELKDELTVPELPELPDGELPELPEGELPEVPELPAVPELPELPAGVVEGLSPITDLELLNSLPAVDELEVQSFDTSRVNEVLYDSFCKECLSSNVLPEDPADDCFSASDCCNENDICFEYRAGPNTGRTECRACGAPEQEAVCYQDADCCGSTVDGVDIPGLCLFNQCRTRLCESRCIDDSDCATDLGFKCYTVPTDTILKSKVCSKQPFKKDVNYRNCEPVDPVIR